MRVAITGSHGLIGSALVPALHAAGHSTVALERSAPGPGALRWDPTTGTLDPAGLVGVDAVIHLAGAGILRRWSAAGRDAVLSSRVTGTSLVARTLAGMEEGPKILLSGSATGLYGDRGDEVLDEDSASGSGFLADVCRQWEAAAAPAIDAGLRTVFLRTGIVQSPAGGALKPQKALWSLGLGGRLGSGKQWVSWISIDDEVGAILHALTTESLEGPVNLTSPNPVTNAQYTRALGRVLRRPAVLAVPGPVLSAVLGSQMAHEMLLGGQRVLPRRLEASGYRFRHHDLDGALAELLGR